MMFTVLLQTQRVNARSTLPSRDAVSIIVRQNLPLRCNWAAALRHCRSHGASTGESLLKEDFAAYHLVCRLSPDHCRPCKLHPTLRALQAAALGRILHNPFVEALDQIAGSSLHNSIIANRRRQDD